MKTPLIFHSNELRALAIAVVTVCLGLIAIIVSQLTEGRQVLSTLPMYGLAMVIAVTVVAGLVVRELQSWELDSSRLDWAMVVVVTCGLVGARFSYLISQPQLFAGDLTAAIAIWQGGLTIWGVVLGGLVGIVVANYLLFGLRGSQLRQLLEIVAVYLPLGQIVGRFGNYFNQELYGPAAEHWLRLEVAGKGYEPLFWYEQLGNLLLLVILVLVRKQGGRLVFPIYLIGYGCVRLILEPWRPESAWLWELKFGQWMAILFIILGIIVMVYDRLIKTK